MKLFAVLCWWDEPPTWLMATIHSLTRIGVDHIVAVDGAYPGVEGATLWSGVEQSDAVQLAADAAGIGLTLHRPGEFLTEREKRSLAFRLVIAAADPMRDWVTVIDADEVIVNEISAKQWLDTAGPTDHVGGAKMVESIDPATTAGKNNTPHTPQLYQKMDIPARGEQWGTRFWRVMPEMWVQDNHYSYHGRDEGGRVWNLRPDLAGASVGEPAGVLLPEMPVYFEHRDPWRTANRRRIKREYYDIRNAAGWEAVPDEHRYDPHGSVVTT